MFKKCGNVPLLTSLVEKTFIRGYNFRQAWIMRFLPIFTLSILLLLLLTSFFTLPFRFASTSGTPVTITKHVEIGFTSNIPINFHNGPTCDFSIFGCVFSHSFSFVGNAVLIIDLGVDVSISYDPSLIVPSGSLPVTITYTPTPGGSSAEFDISGSGAGQGLTLSFTGCVSCPTNAPFTLASGSATFTAPMGTNSPVSIPGFGSSLDLSNIIYATLNTNLMLGPAPVGLFPGLGGAAALVQVSGATTSQVLPIEWDSSGASQVVTLSLPSNLLHPIGISLDPLIHWLSTSGSVQMALHWGPVADGVYDALRIAGCNAIPFWGNVICLSSTSSTPPDPSPITIFSGSLGQFFTEDGVNTQIGNAVAAAVGGSEGTTIGNEISINIGKGILPIPLLSPPLANFAPPTAPTLGSVYFGIWGGIASLNWNSEVDFLVTTSSGQAGCSPSGEINTLSATITGCGTGQVDVNIPTTSPGVYSVQFFPPTGGPVQLGVQSFDAAGDTLDTLSLTNVGPGTTPQITLSTGGDLTSPIVSLPLDTTPVPVSGTEGIPLTNQPVTTFTDPDGNTDPTQYSATINWGDGISSLGTVTYSSGIFTVAGDHTYSEQGTYSVNTNIEDAESSMGSATSTATIAGAGLSGSLSAFSASAGTPAGGAIATFQDGDNNFAFASDFTASINWGDGSSPSVGNIGSNTGGSFTVYAVHTYSSAGSFPLSVTISEADGLSSITLTSSAVGVTVLSPLCVPNVPPVQVDGVTPTAQDSCTWSSGQFSSTNPQVYSSDTGMSVAITNAPAGTASVSILLSDLGATPSQGADTIANGPTYYDVNIGSITTGTAQVCISNPSSSSTLMDYWSGTAWVPASNVGAYTSTLASFPYICGTIPVSSATGTPIGVGSPDTTVTSMKSKPSYIPVGGTVTLTGTVTDTQLGTTTPTPTGTISWSDGGAGGTFSGTSTCTLKSSKATSTSSSCKITYTPSPFAVAAGGEITLTATYSGDSSHGASSAQLTLSLLRTTTTTIQPPSTTIGLGASQVYTVIVTDTSPGVPVAPTGTVSWSASPKGVGSFSSGHCTLAPITSTESSCTVTYTSSTSGSPTITAVYKGDSEHYKSQGTAALTIT